MKHKLMQAMADREAPRSLSGLMQIDAPYLGDERNGGKAKREPENKVPFAFAFQTTEEGHLLYVVIEPLPDFTSTALANGAKIGYRGSQR